MIRLSCIDTQREKLAAGIGCVIAAIVCYNTGHNILGGAMVGAAAPLLFQLSKKSAEKLSLSRPAHRLIASMAAAAIGTGTEMIAARACHGKYVGVGVALNAVANIYASHHVPWSDVWGWITRPKSMLTAGPE